MSVEITNLDLESLYWKVSGTAERFSSDDVFNHVLKESESTTHDIEIAVGTDSQIIGKTFRFISVVCIYRKGKGGWYYYFPEIRPRDKYQINNQKMRMFDEVARSIELSNAIVDNTGVIPVVHIDASPQMNKEFTSGFSDQLKGYVQACGFECRLKPESYVANCIADKHSKKQRKKRRRKYRGRR